MEETRELAVIVMSNKVNYRASNTRLRYQLVLSALVFCLGATYGVKELKIPGVLTFVSAPNVNLILLTILGFSIFTSFCFVVQHSLYGLENPAERNEINDYRRRINEEVKSIKSNIDLVKKTLGSVIEAYSNLPEEKISRVRIFDEDKEPKPEDTNLLEVNKFVAELKSISVHSRKIIEDHFSWEGDFSGAEAPNKTFLIACENVRSNSLNLASYLKDRSINEDVISSFFDEISDCVSRMEIRHRKFRATLKSFSDARWLDRVGLPFLVPLIVWAFLVICGVIKLGPKLVEVNKSSVLQQSVSDEMGEP